MERRIKIKVRLMVDSDVAQVVNVENCWDYLSKWGEEGYRNVLRYPYVYHALVAEDRRPGPMTELETPSVVGVAVLALLVNHGELCNLIVPPQYLGKKVGQLLLGQCLEVAQKRALRRICLEVRHSNCRAIRFYERNGFQIISSRSNYYRDPLEDAWLMERQVAAVMLQDGCLKA